MFSCHDQKSKIKSPLQAHTDKKLYMFRSGRRIYKTAPSDGSDQGKIWGDKGSASVEASIVLPIFICAMLVIFGMIGCIRTKGIIYEGLQETAAYLAEYSYLTETPQQNDKERGIGSAAISVVTAGIRLGQYIDDRTLVDRYVVGGTGGLKVLQAELGSDDYIYVRVKYVLGLDIPFAGKMKVVCEEKIRQRAYLGYDKAGDGDSDGKYVYVAENGAVYHNSRNCYHIKLTIRQINEASLHDKYDGLTECHLCRRFRGKNTVYVTAQGNRYHYSLGCSGLKRTIYRVKTDGKSGLRPCSECGK